MEDRSALLFFFGAATNLGDARSKRCRVSSYNDFSSRKVIPPDSCNRAGFNLSRTRALRAVIITIEKTVRPLDQ